MLRVPCITLREETEWVETIDIGWNRLTGTNTQSILEAAEEIIIPENYPNLFGDGYSSRKICEILMEYNL